MKVQWSRCPMTFSIAPWFVSEVLCNQNLGSLSRLTSHYAMWTLISSHLDFCSAQNTFSCSNLLPCGIYVTICCLLKFHPFLDLKTNCHSFRKRLSFHIKQKLCLFSLNSWIRLFLLSHVTDTYDVLYLNFLCITT